MKYLVTGATGYIGRNLVNYLVNNLNQVGIIVRESSDLSIFKDNINKGNIKVFYYRGNYKSIEEIFQSSEFDVVLHLASFASYSIESKDIGEMILSNITFGSYLLEAMAKYNCSKFVNTGTYWQNSLSDKYNPICFYAATKQSFENIVDYFVLYKNISCITLKLLDTYGKSDNRNKIFNLLEQSYKNNSELNMTKGEQKINLVYIDDVVAAFVHACQLLNKNPYSGSHSRFYVAGKESLSLKEIVKTYMEVTGRNISINWGAMDYRKQQIMTPYIGDILPEWEAKYGIKQGIRKLNDEQ